MDLLIRYTVTASFSVTLGINSNQTLEGDHLRDVLAENILSMLDGSVHNLSRGIDAVRIEEICDDSDRCITTTDEAQT